VVEPELGAEVGAEGGPAPAAEVGVEPAPAPVVEPGVGAGVEPAPAVEVVTDRSPVTGPTGPTGPSGAGPAPATPPAPLPDVDQDTTEVEDANPVADLITAPSEPDELERQLAEDEAMERRSRHEHHEAPHFRREAD
jgi:hypothetical protein